MANQISLPNSSDRTAVIGRTGSGKTYFAVWLLSMQDIETRPWIIVDYKNDELINSIEKAVIIDYDKPLPERPGIYILKVLPGEDDELDEFFRRVWEHGEIGIFIDEAAVMGIRGTKYFNGCLTQGRSKKIPCIVLAQRPAFISRYVLSEASYIVVFDLTDDKDKDRLQEWIKANIKKDLPKHCAYYYSVNDKSLSKIPPVPNERDILARFEKRLAKRTRTL